MGLQFSHANFREHMREKACFRMHMLSKIHTALCPSEMKRSGIELMAEL
ncbi:hypothetical protein [Muricomes intestini]|jgi:hypothetical protein